MFYLNNKLHTSTRLKIYDFKKLKIECLDYSLFEYKYYVVLSISYGVH